jgi:hypothetical protein
METDIEARLADIRSELEAQNEQWQAARQALIRLGCEQVKVPRELLRRLDALVPRRPTGVHGLRG